MKDRHDDVGREEGERDQPADVALINSVAFDKISNRPRIAFPELRKPILFPCDRGDRFMHASFVAEFQSKPVNFPENWVRQLTMKSGVLGGIGDHARVTTDRTCPSE